MDTTLTGRHALVCGASAGIGRATALAFAARGATVTVLARREDRLQSLLPELAEAGAPEAHALVVDLEDLAAVHEIVGAHLIEHGDLHILVNNAGGPAPGPVLEAHVDAFEQGFRRHVLASHTLVQQLLPGMINAHYGRILNIISTSVREPIPNLGVSNTIRGAMASWAKSVANELPPGITINNILPGFTDTERLAALGRARAERSGTTVDAVTKAWLAQVPEGRLAHAEEPAELMAFLASPAGAYIRGTSIPVDGGRKRSI